MPRNVTIPDPAEASTVGLSLQVTRLAAGAAGVQLRFDYPADAGGAFVATAADLTPAGRTALKTVLDEMVALFKAARGY